MKDNYMEKASFFRRVIAYLIDLIIMLFLFISSSIIGIILKIPMTETKQDIIIALPSCLYLIFKDLIFNGASIGKKLLSIKIVQKHTYTAPNKIRIIIKTILSLDVITNSFLYYNSKETFSELLTNTIVVKSSKYLERALEKENKRKTGDGKDRGRWLS